MRLVPLGGMARCGVFDGWMRQCTNPAHWLVNGNATCDEHLEGMTEWIGFVDGDEAVFTPVLADIAQRREGQQ